MKVAKLTALVFVLLLIANVAFAEVQPQPWPYQLGPIFQSASVRYQIPLPLLLTLAHFGSGFENRGDAPSIENGYGVMALRKNSLGGTSLAEAATLTSVSESDLKLKADANIMGAAAVLDSYAKMWQVDRSAGLDAWLNVIIKYAALDPATDKVPVYSRFFAMEIYEKLTSGLDDTNSSGEHFTFAPQSIGSISLVSLEPPGARVNVTGYSGASWYSAGTCNYQAISEAKNTVVIHTIEGSASGCLSWFNNCSAQVSSHYVVSEAGGVWQCVDEWYRAWHVGCANSYCIGLEHEGYASYTSHPAALYNASALCVRDICNRWGIPKQHNTCPPGILGHVDINNCVCGGSHWDPGGGWDWGYYIQQVIGTPAYAASYSNQSYPATMVAGTTASAWAEYTNTGTTTWSGTKLGTSGPQDRSSPFYNSADWLSPTRSTVVDQSSVSQGQLGRFSFVLLAPSTPGVYVEKFRPVQESVTWFGDEITWTITVTPNTGNITGTVRNLASSQMIAGATVSIAGGSSTTTNASGVYNFTGLAPSTYTLNVSMCGFDPASDTAAVTIGNTTTKNFSLSSTESMPPSTPQNLRSTGATASSVSLAWDASTDNCAVAGYRIYRNHSVVGTTAGTTYTDSGLMGSTAYTYEVDAYDNAPNYSPMSAPISVTTSSVVVVDPADQTGYAIGSWTGDSDIVPTAAGGPWALSYDCGTSRYVFSHFTDCSARGANVTYDCGFVWSGRGWIHMDYVVAGAQAYTNDILRYRNQAGALTGQTSTINTCNYLCSWQSVLDGATDNVYDWNGMYLNADESTSTCGSICGGVATATREIHMYGSRYQYINDWTCLGPAGTANPGAIAENPTGLDEANLYLYPAVDTTHGNVLRFGSTNLAPGRVTTGDCNNANTLDFKGNAGAYGADYANAYGFAWVYAPGGAGPKFDIASDDGNRVWVNGNLINDNNAFRGLTRDSDVTGGIGLGAGWNRVLLKVHNGTGGFAGTISLRNGGDNRANEPSVNVFDLGGYSSYGLGYEQDAWYPHIDVATFDGQNNPQAGAQLYTNNTTVTASGSYWMTGPVPFWKTMHFEWGYGLSADTDYTDVTSNGTTWSHAQTGVSGHRRFHFFGVSQSHRTSFQSGANSGKNGGWVWSDGGPGNYMDVYVDNAAPLDPSLSGIAPTSPNQVDLLWALPLDQGVGIAPGAAEDLATGGDNHYRVGDVGVDVRRNGASIYGWGTGTSVSDTGLDSNTTYSYDIAARDNTGESRGAWHNATGYAGPISVCTLADAPADGVNVTAPAPGTFTTAAWPGLTSSRFGTGSGLVTKFKYKWSTSASDSIGEGEGTDWSGGALSALPGSDGTYYLYLRSYNAADFGNGSTQFGAYTISSVALASSASPAGGVYNSAQNIALSANQTATIYYTTDGSEPTTGSSTYSTEIPVSADTTLRFFAVAGSNTESPSKQEVYAILADDGTIAEAKQATLGAPVRLGEKALYLKSGSFGYIEEANRLVGIRVEGTISADEGQLVCLTGTRAVSANGEPCITVSQMTPDGPGTVAPWGTNGRTFQYNLLDGLNVTTWGLVKVGSIIGNSYVLTTGSTDTEIKVITKATPTVGEGNFVIVTGAVGFGATRVVYQK